MEPESSAKVRGEPTHLKSRSRAKLFFLIAFFGALIFALILGYWKRDPLLRQFGVITIEKMDERVIERFSEIDQRFEKIENQVALALEKLEQLKERLSSREDDSKAHEVSQINTRKDELYRALEQLRAKLKTSGPYTAELEKAKDRAGDAANLQELLLRLEPFANVGIPSLSYLRAELADLEKGRRGKSSEREDDVWQKTKGLLTGIVRIEKKEEAAEAGEERAGPPNLKDLLEKDELEAVLRAVRNMKVSESFEQKKTTWIQHAEARLIYKEAEDALAHMLLQDF